MKLETSIPMRADGTVVVHGLDKQDYEFKLDAESGMVVCDIEHTETLAHLLSLGGFFPANEADHEKASALMEKKPDEVVDQEGDDDEDDIVNENALPIESATPPAPSKKAKAK